MDISGAVAHHKCPAFCLKASGVVGDPASGHQIFPVCQFVKGRFTEIRDLIAGVKSFHGSIRIKPVAASVDRQGFCPRIIRNRLASERIFFLIIIDQIVSFIPAAVYFSF